LIDTRPLTDRVVEQGVEQMQDHRQTLAEFSTRLEKFADHLIEAWTKAYRDAERAAQQPLDAETLSMSRQGDLAQSLFGELKQGHLRQAFASLAIWSQDLARSGLAYDPALKLIREHQRAAMELALPMYQDDPQLALVLDALDDWYDNAVSVASAAYLEARPVVVAPL
jgi:hypothetical protein